MNFITKNKNKITPFDPRYAIYLYYYKAKQDKKMKDIKSKVSQVQDDISKMEQKKAEEFNHQNEKAEILNSYVQEKFSKDFKIIEKLTEEEKDLKIFEKHLENLEMIEKYQELKKKKILNEKKIFEDTVKHLFEVEKEKELKVLEHIKGNDNYALRLCQSKKNKIHSVVSDFRPLIKRFDKYQKDNYELKREVDMVKIINRKMEELFTEQNNINILLRKLIDKKKNKKENNFLFSEKNNVIETIRSDKLIRKSFKKKFKSKLNRVKSATSFSSYSQKNLSYLKKEKINKNNYKTKNIDSSSVCNNNNHYKSTLNIIGENQKFQNSILNTNISSEVRGYKKNFKKIPIIKSQLLNYYNFFQDSQSSQNKKKNNILRIKTGEKILLDKKKKINKYICRHNISAQNENTISQNNIISTNNTISNNKMKGVSSSLNTNKPNNSLISDNNIKNLKKCLNKSINNIMCKENNNFIIINNNLTIENNNQTLQKESNINLNQLGDFFSSLIKEKNKEIDKIKKLIGEEVKNKYQIKSLIEECIQDLKLDMIKYEKYYKITEKNDKNKCEDDKKKFIEMNEEKLLLLIYIFDNCFIKRNDIKSIFPEFRKENCK